jgi:hypothetical protein
MRHPVKKLELIRMLYDALALTRIDAERHGFKYGSQSNCAVAMRKAQKFLDAERQQKEKRE